MTRPRAPGPAASRTHASAPTLQWAFVAVLGCTTNDPPPAPQADVPPPAIPTTPPPDDAATPPVAATRPPASSPPEALPPAALPGDEPHGDPDELPTPLLDVQLPVDAAAGPLHLAARRYGPLRLQRLTREQLAVRGTLALALVDKDGQLRRAQGDLAGIDLAAVADIGDVQAFGGRWPDRSFIVGTLEDMRTTFPTVWRRADARWRSVDNSTYEGTDELQWQYELSAPWGTGETVVVRVLSTLPDPIPGDPGPDDPEPAPSIPVKAIVELIGPEETELVAPTPAPAPVQRDADTPEAVPNPDPTPAPSDSPPVPSTSPEPAAPPVSSASPEVTPPVPSTSSARPAPPPIKFPRLARKQVPRALTTTGDSAYVLVQDGSILQASPRPRKPGKWKPLPATDLPKPGPKDFIRLHGTDAGALYVLACIGGAPLLKHWDGSAWFDDDLPSAVACPTSVAESGGVLWLATAPVDGHTLWQRGVDGFWTAVDLPRLPWPELAWERWFAYVPTAEIFEGDEPIWERDPPPKLPPPLSPELRASEVVAHGGDVWVLASASIGRDIVPHVVLSTRRPASAIEFPARAEEGLDAEDSGDEPYDETCTRPFLRLRDLGPDEHGADLIPPLQGALGVRPDLADSVLVEALRSDGRRQLGAVWTNADALDESFGPLGELGDAVDKLRPEVEPTMLCLIPRVRFGVAVLDR